jgi:DEAD/DEAH box helicase domain-containing protein
MARGSLIDTQWGIAIAPARRDGRIVAESSEPDRTAKPVALPGDLAPDLAEALRRAGIESLYSHQLRAWKTAPGSDLIITSGTASGKSLAFNLPVLDAIARAPKSRALYLYPTRTRPASLPCCARRTCATRSTTATRRARSARRSGANRT